MKKPYVPTAAHLYLGSIHHRGASVSYVDEHGEAGWRRMRFLHTEGWSDDDVIAAVRERHPSWSNISLGLQDTFTPSRDARPKKRDLALEAEILGAD